jgi:hypothetical protein
LLHSPTRRRDYGEAQAQAHRDLEARSDAGFDFFRLAAAIALGKRNHQKTRAAHAPLCAVAQILLGNPRPHKARHEGRRPGFCASLDALIITAKSQIYPLAHFFVSALRTSQPINTV